MWQHFRMERELTPRVGESALAVPPHHGSSWTRPLGWPWLVLHQASLVHFIHILSVLCLSVYALSDRQHFNIWVVVSSSSISPVESHWPSLGPDAGLMVSSALSLSLSRSKAKISTIRDKSVRSNGIPLPASKMRFFMLSYPKSFHGSLRDRVCYLASCYLPAHIWLSCPGFCEYSFLYPKSHFLPGYHLLILLGLTERPVSSGSPSTAAGCWLLALQHRLYQARPSGEPRHLLPNHC